MKRTVDDDEATVNRMEEKVAKQNEVYVRRQCRKCSNITGDFSTSNLSERRTCGVRRIGAFTACGGDMEEIWRGKI